MCIDESGGFVPFRLLDKDKSDPILDRLDDLRVLWTVIDDEAAG
jgi:hypothetical protein